MWGHGGGMSLSVSHTKEYPGGKGEECEYTLSFGLLSLLVWSIPHASGSVVCDPQASRWSGKVPPASEARVVPAPLIGPVCLGCQGCLTHLAVPTRHLPPVLQPSSHSPLPHPGLRATTRWHSFPCFLYPSCVPSVNVRSWQVILGGHGQRIQSP